MQNLAGRLKKLELRRFDATGLAPHSDAWFAFYEDRVARHLTGEDAGYVPLEVIRRIIDAVPREDQALVRQNRDLECPA